MDSRPNPDSHRATHIGTRENGSQTVNTYLIVTVFVALGLQWLAPDQLRAPLTTVTLLNLLIPLISSWIPGFAGEKQTSQHPVFRKRLEMETEMQRAPIEITQTIQKAMLLQMQGSFEESVKFASVIALAEKTLRTNHPAILRASNIKARSFFELRKFDNALLLFEENYETARDVYHDNHPWIVHIALELAGCHIALLQLDKASEYAREALRMVRNMDQEAGARTVETTGVEDQVINALFSGGHLKECLDVVNTAAEGLGILRVDKTPDSNLLVARLYEARALVFLGEHAKAIQISDEVRQAMKTLEMTQDSPQYLSMASILHHISIGMLDYGPWETHFDKKGHELMENLNIDKAKKGPTVTLAIETGMNLLVTTISKAYARKFEEASKLLQRIVPEFKSLEESPQMRLQMSYIIWGCVLCWQHKLIDADEHVSGASMECANFFGFQSPEHALSLTLHGFILLNRGKFELSIATLALASHGLKQTKVEKWQTAHDLLTRQYTALGHLCLGRNGKAKAILTSVHSDAKAYWGAVHPATKLSARCLGSVAALDGDFQQAITWLRVSLQSTGQFDIPNGKPLYEDHVGNTMGKWSLAWALHEQGETDEAVKLLVAVEQDLKSEFGCDHKLTIGCSHDLLWISRHIIPASDGFSKLHQTASEVLGEGHNLTKKIARTIEIYENEQQCGEMRKNRVWVLGESGDRPMQVSDVDWLTWHWLDGDHRETIIEKMLLRSGSELGVLSSDSTSQSAPPLRFARKLDVQSFHQFSSLITKLLLEFPRDFTPTFVEATYSSQAEVPYKELAKLGPSVVKVRHPETDQLFARKFLRYGRSDIRTQVHAEVNMMRKLSHPHIVKLCCSYAIPSEGFYALLLEPVADYDLRVFLQTCSEQEYPDSMLNLLPGWFACLLNALDYLHSRKIKHRDIKAGNILVKQDVAYFTDFGSAKDWSDNNTSATKGTSIGYTEKYGAPEVVKWDDDEDIERTRGIDVFSLGCVFAEMATVLTKRSVKEFDKYRRSCNDEENFCDCLGSTLDDWMEQTPLYKSFIKEMMAEKASERPSPRELISRLEKGITGGYGPLLCQHKCVTTDKA